MAHVPTPAVPSRGTLTRRVCGAVALVGAALVLAQAVLAGHLLTGNDHARALHQILGTEGIGILLVVQFITAVLVWRPGRGPWWPIPATVVLYLVVGFQIGRGFEGRVAVHVPLGVTILLLELAIAGLLLRSPRRAAVTDATGADAAPVSGRR